MKSGRYYNCARCKTQVIICRKCDRGNIYCGPICAKRSRTKNHQLANQKYQATAYGRRSHAYRQSRYRERQKQKVTDQGSIVLPTRDVLPSAPNEPKMQQKEGDFCCNFCGATIIHLRYGFLRYENDEYLQKSSSWSLGP